MSMRYPTLQNADLDKEEKNRFLVPGAWTVTVMEEVHAAGCGQRQTRQGKELRMYLKNYYNSEEVYHGSIAVGCSLGSKV